MSTQEFETLDSYLSEQLQDPDFRAEWDALEPAYQLARLRITRGLLCTFFVIVSCALSTAVLYWIRKKRWEETWGQIPSNEWEQVASFLHSGLQFPLDTSQILADIDEWLREELAD